MFDEVKSLSKHFLIYGLGRVLGKLAAFVLIPLYTHYLTTSEYGKLELLELTTYIVGMFVAAGIGQAVMRFYYETDDLHTQKSIVSTSLIAVWTISLTSTVLLIIFSSQISTLVFQSTENNELYQLVFLSMMIAITNEIPLSFIRAQQKSLIFTIISVIQLTIALSLNILFIVGFGLGIKGIILSGMISQGMVGLYLATYTFKFSGLHFSFHWFYKMIRYGLPFIPVGLGYFILNFTDRFFLQRFVSLSDVGIYGLGYKFGMIISPMITDPFLSIFQPKMFEFTSEIEAKKFASLILTYLVFLEVFAGLIISVFIKDALQVMVGVDFLHAYKVVPLIVASYILMACNGIIQVGLLIRMKTKWIAIIVGISALANIILNYFLIPIFGYMGAAYATFVSFTLLLVICYKISNKTYHVNYQLYRIVKIIAVAISLFSISKYIHFDSMFFSLLVKMILVLTFPLLLYLIKFYTVKELKRINLITQKISATVFKMNTL